MKTKIRYQKPSGLDGVELLHLSDPDFEFKPHVHDSYVFWFNGLGGERVSLGGSSDILQPDSFGVVAPGEVHANHAVTEKRTLESLYVTQAAIDDVACQLGCSGGQFRSRLQKDIEARSALWRLHSTLMNCRDPFLEQQTFVETFELLLNRHGEHGRRRGKAKAPLKIMLAKVIMKEKLGDNLELDELASLCGCSSCHLVRLFRREVGMTPHAYLMELRLGHAKHLMVGKDSLADIAADSGFTDQSHMTRRFVARFGLTPGRYRQQVSS